MFHFVVSQVAILCYSGPAFWPRTPPLFDGKLETFIKLISKSLTVYQIPYEYVAKFLDYETFNFQEVLNSCPLPLSSPRSFCANNFISRNYSMFYCLLFEDFKDHRFLEVCSKSLVQRHYFFYNVFYECLKLDPHWPFRGCGGLVGCDRALGLGACAPRIPMFILLVSFSGTLLVVSILDRAYDCHLCIAICVGIALCAAIAICDRFCSPEGVKTFPLIF